MKNPFKRNHDPELNMPDMTESLQQEHEEDMPAPEDVEVGQIYSDNDPRQPRVLRVLSVDAAGTTALVQNIATKRRTSVSCERLLRTNHRGFTYEGHSK